VQTERGNTRRVRQVSRQAGESSDRCLSLKQVL